MGSVARAETEGGGFCSLLRHWRQRRRISQLELSLRCGISQRHLSFLESARSRPSRSMILRLSEALEVPLRERNQWLHAAGFAPVYRALELDSPEMRPVMAAVQMMLRNHEPFPAAALDRSWNIRLANQPFERLSAWLGGELWERVGGSSRNLIRLLFHPDGLRPFVSNWETIAPCLWQRAEREAMSAHGTEAQRLLDELRPMQEEHVLSGAAELPLLPVLPLQLEHAGVRLSLFTVIATFGTPQDVTTDELRIESLFPADDETEHLLRAW
jgi:transcriptional regulator with XRE-family HTH domain